MKTNIIKTILFYIWKDYSKNKKAFENLFGEI
jgi:hypothetical protein